MQNIFRVLILTGRPAAGKSEVIDFLKKTSLEERIKRFRIGHFEEIDDFPFLWEKFEEDDIFTKYGKERLYTTKDYYFKDEFFWTFMIEKINLAFHKKLRSDPDFTRTKTAIIEFSRGGENGLRDAFNTLSNEILKIAAIVYIDVSYEESVRKNKRRKVEGLEDSILHHSLPDDKMEKYYKINDWEKLSGGKLYGLINIQSINVPFSVLQNEPEVTDRPEKLAPALENVLKRLWKIYS